MCPCSGMEATCTLGAQGGQVLQEAKEGGQACARAHHDHWTDNLLGEPECGPAAGPGQGLGGCTAARACRLALLGELISCTVMGVMRCPQPGRRLRMTVACLTWEDAQQGVTCGLLPVLLDLSSCWWRGSEAEDSSLPS